MQAVEAARALYRREGPRVRDGAAVAFGLLLTLLAAKTPWSPAPRPLILLAGCAGSGVLWWRRRWPVTTTAIGVGAFVASGNPWPLMVGLSTTASARRDRLLVVVTGAAGVGFALPVMIDLERFDLNALVSGLAEAGFVAMVGVYLGTRQELLISLRDRAQRAEAERELRDEQARAGERARITREMHDVLAHKVSLIALHAGALEVNPTVEPSRVEEVAGVIRTTARQTLEELRTVLAGGGSGGPPDELGAGEGLVPPPQAADVGRLVDASRAAGVAVDLHVDLPARGDPGPGLPDAVARAVHRVVQEGLTNVHKHAPGAAAEVAIGGDEASGITVSVVNGPPAGAGPLLPGSGAGLVGLHERVRLAGGTLRCGPEAGGGWRLDAWLPWSPGAPGEAAGP